MKTHARRGGKSSSDAARHNCIAVVEKMIADVLDAFTIGYSQLTALAEVGGADEFDDEDRSNLIAEAEAEAAALIERAGIAPVFSARGEATE